MIDVKSAKVCYPGFESDLSLHLEEGMITGLAGVNGSGKTTLFRLLTGLEKPESGSVQVFGIHPDQMSASQKQKIGVVFADSGYYSGYTPADVAKIEAAFYPDFDQALYEELCKRFSIRTKQPISSMSTGEKARFRVIAAISHQPDLLILDEPTVGLDVLARNEILSLIQEYMETPGRSVLISSHIGSDLETLCDQFFLISQGRICMEGRADQLLDEYGLLRLSGKQISDETFPTEIVRKQVPGGWQVLVADRQYYRDNYPDFVLEKASIDDLIFMISKDEQKN